MGWNEISNSVCQIAGALAVVGDRWTLLIMRELFLGTKRFDDIMAQTGMSSHLLSARLKRMEGDGLIERRRYTDSPPRFEYDATAKGKELDAVLLVLRAWGMRWGASTLGAEPAIRLHYRATGEAMNGDWVVPRGRHAFTFDDTTHAMHEAFLHERESKAAAFLAAKRRTAVPLKKA